MQLSPRVAPPRGDTVTVRRPRPAPRGTTMWRRGPPDTIYFTFLIVMTSNYFVLPSRRLLLFKI